MTAELAFWLANWEAKLPGKAIKGDDRPVL
jgi:hypothetical protein